MNEQESLAAITNMINDSKTNFKEQSFYYLLWGWLVVGAVIAESILYNLGIVYHPIVWFIMGTVGGITSGIYGKKNEKKAGYSTYTDRAMKYVWLGFVLYMFVIIVMSATGKFGSQGWSSSFQLIMGLYGLGTFISGGLLKFKPLVYGGIASFVLVGITILLPTVFSDFSAILPMLAVSIIVSYLVPGYLLKRS